MALFGLGKKEERRSMRSEMDRLPTLPEFPSAEEHEDIPELPHYEPSISELKREVEKPALDIPVREKRVIPIVSAQVSRPSYLSTGEEKPLFIKVDRYKEALRAIDSLKAKITEAENVLRTLEDIREDESRKLESWKSEIQSLKDKLLTIDQSLFEA